MSYFHQKTKVSEKYINKSRFEIIPLILKNKKILHIGCMDWPITNYEKNLHCLLDNVAEELVGVDPNNENFEELKAHIKNKELYVDVKNILDREFDVLLIPEVLEHVDNIGDFLESMSLVKAKKIIITVPDAFMCRSRHFKYEPNGDFIEIVHPDHNCWFSPYTLRNVVEKFTNWNFDSMYFIENMSVMGIFNAE
jgi:hypothetical protein